MPRRIIVYIQADVATDRKILKKEKTTMNRIMNSTLKRITVRGIFLAVCIISLAMQPFTPSGAFAATTLPVLWTAGGHSAGADSAGPAARMAVDGSGNVAIVSGPAGGGFLAVTSYTPDGQLRWRSTIAPISGVFGGYWVVAAPNGDFVALGIQGTSSMVAVTLVRFASDGTFQWRVDTNSGGVVLSVGRLVVDGQGNAYLPFNSILHKYSPSGVLLWETPTSVRDVGTALSPDGADVVVTGATGGNWRTAAFDTATGAPKWLVVAPEGIATTDLVVDETRVYVTGKGVTGASTPAIAYFLTVVAYDRATGARLWRTDSRPANLTEAAGLRLAQGPDGNLVVTGQAAVSGCLSWWTVALNAADGAVKWQAQRDTTPLCLDEVPAVVFVLPDGTTVVSGTGGPPVVVMGSSYLVGATVGYSPDGTLLWEAFSSTATVWAAALPSGDVSATGGADALITCWQVPGAANFQPVLTASPLSGPAALTVNFTRSVTTDPNGPIIGFVTLEYGDTAPGMGGTLDFGDGTQTFTLNKTSIYTYNTAGTYTATLTVFYNNNTSVSKTVTIVVSPSVTPAEPPLITASPVSGTVPLTVTFTSSAASNPPLIGSYTVNYGDGTSDQIILNAGDPVPSFTGNTTHTYTAAGTYIATLTVFYANATNASSAVTITVNPVVATPVLKSTAINLSATLQRSKVNVTGNVTVKNGSGAAVSGAVVSTTWTRPGSGTVTQTATTSSSGIARFSTSGGRGTYTLTVNNISKTGYSFDSANSVLSKSITKYRYQ